jgi:uncharacterized protein YdcH (DUF465 family)
MKRKTILMNNSNLSANSFQNNSHFVSYKKVILNDPIQEINSNQELNSNNEISHLSEYNLKILRAE